MKEMKPLVIDRQWRCSCKLCCRLPCDELTGKLVYARTVDGSVWVPLLEKAMAKFCGCSYSGLHGGNTAWALATLTGLPCFKFRYDAPSGRWRRHELVSTHVQGARQGGQASRLNRGFQPQ